MNSSMPTKAIDPQFENPVSTTERLARYETAQEIIGMMIALQAEQLADEEGKTHPDPARILALQAEQARLTAERHALRFEDTASIRQAIEDYAPIVKAAFGA